MQLTAPTSPTPELQERYLGELKLMLQDDQWQLCKLAFSLYQRELKEHSDFVDYSYIVFPMAKAYEGFLKDYLRKMSLIDLQTYQSRRFRIGRALNPDLHPRHQDERWLYDDLAHRCGDATAKQLWKTWLECRNHVFHYFPDQGEEATMSLVTAQSKLVLLAETMIAAWECLKS